MSALSQGNTVTGLRSCRQSSVWEEGDQCNCIKLCRVPLDVERRGGCGGKLQ